MLRLGEERSRPDLGPPPPGSRGSFAERVASRAATPSGHGGGAGGGRAQPGGGSQVLGKSEAYRVAPPSTHSRSGAARAQSGRENVAVSPFSGNAGGRARASPCLLLPLLHFDKKR